MRVTVEGWRRNARRWAVLLAAVLAGTAGAADVLLVSSYDQNDACGRPQYEAALEALKQGGFAGLSSQSYFLDQRTASREQLQQTVEQIKREIRTTRPKLVFAFDDPAFSMLYEEVLLQPGTRMVFSGVNRRLEDYNERTRFVAGFIGSPQMNFLKAEALGMRGETVGIRPEHLAISGKGGAIAGKISHVEKLGGETLVYVKSDVHGLLTVRLFGEHDYAVDADAWLGLDVSRAFHFDAAGQRLR